MAKDKTAKEKTTKEKTDKEKSKKPNKIVKWFKDLKVEFNKVTWATWPTVRNNTSVVLTIVVVLSAFVGLLDWGLLELMNLVYNR